MNFKKILFILFIIFLSLEVSFAASGDNSMFKDNLFNQITDLPKNLFNGFSFDFLSSIGNFSFEGLTDNLHADNSSFVKKHTRYSFNSSDLVKKYNSSDKYSVQVLADGKPVGAGEKVLLRINGVEYVRTTDANGVAHLNINLKPGNYIVFCEYKTFKTYNNIRVI